ncbi:hypothetical protein F5Y07DRAFT_168979 [Xylaria sp. FL0933]|nr:hypothetical protein F5Y07DRAFT_168979 [Xylaria sp. FL0933]
MALHGVSYHPLFHFLQLLTNSFFIYIQTTCFWSFRELRDARRDVKVKDIPHTEWQFSFYSLTLIVFIFIFRRLRRRDLNTRPGSKPSHWRMSNWLFASSHHPPFYLSS